MSTLWRFVPWLNRLVLAAPTMIFVMLTATIFRDPARSASEHGMSLISPIGFTNYRSGNGGIFLGFAVITIACLISTRRHMVGLSFVAIMMGVILAVRGASVMVDGTLFEERPLLIAEAVFLALSCAGLALESARRRRLDDGGLSEPGGASEVESNGRGIAHRRAPLVSGV